MLSQYFGRPNPSRNRPPGRAPISRHYNNNVFVTSKRPRATYRKVLEGSTNLKVREKHTPIYYNKLIGASRYPLIFATPSNVFSEIKNSIVVFRTYIYIYTHTRQIEGRDPYVKFTPVEKVENHWRGCQNENCHLSLFFHLIRPS